jgi:hypothetical protein
MTTHQDLEGTRVAFLSAHHQGQVIELFRRDHGGGTRDGLGIGHGLRRAVIDIGPRPLPGGYDAVHPIGS